MKTLLFVSLVVSIFSIEAQSKQSFELVAVEASGTRVWLPSVLVVKEGEDVEIHAVSKVAAPNNVHGLYIPAFNISEAVDEKGKTIQFKAKKAGVYDMKCHMHPTHIGGQLLVIKR